MSEKAHESVAAGHTVPKPTREEAAQLAKLYRYFDEENLIPLWTEIADLDAGHREEVDPRISQERPFPVRLDFGIHVQPM